MNSNKVDVELNSGDKKDITYKNSTYTEHFHPTDKSTTFHSTDEDDRDSGGSTNQVTPDEILHQIGGCGKFQILLVIIVHAMKTVVCWSMVGNAFFAFTPRWRCADDDHVTLANTSKENGEYNMTLLGNSSMDNWNMQCTTAAGKTCQTFEFEEGTTTFVTEFDLICDMSWVPATITSLQMVGMCLGSFLCGQLADLLGRRGVMFTSMVLLSIFHLVSYFPTSWIQIAVARFFVGIGCSFYLATCYTIMTEFTLSRWRAVVTSFPSWALEGSLFALVAYLLHDWKKLTLVMCLLAFGTLSAWFYVPESVRWLLTHNRQHQAEKLVTRISRWNNTRSADFQHMCDMIAREKSETTVKKYTVVDLFRRLALLKITLPLAVVWLAMGLIAYGINFAVQKLSGNIYLNLFLFAMAALPAKLLSIFLQTRIGRKFAATAAFTVCFVGGLVVGIIQYIDTPYRDSLSNYCALAASVGVDGTWGPMQTQTLELYPTVVRNTGFGFVSIFARIGAVIGPQFVYLSDFVPGLLFFVVAAMALCSMLSVATLPETRNTTMLDRLGEKLERTREMEDKP